jgi:MSHA biogenesis protein MshQ
MDQPFEFDTPPVISIRALNAAGAKTENYEGEFWKLGVSLNRDSSCDGTGTNVGFCYSDNVAGAAGLTVPDSAQTYGATADIGGEVVLTLHGATTDTFRYSRPSTGLVTPFDADVDLTVRVRDSDLRAGSSLASRIGFVGDTDAGGLNFNLTNDYFLRYGRWQMENAFGPEISNLRIPASAEFYNAAGVWVTNTADICTNLIVDPLSPSSATLVNLTDAASSVYDDLSKLASVSIGTGTSAFSFDGPLALGDAGFDLTAPNSEGYVDIDVDLTTLNWLRFDWDGNGSFEDHGTVRATFGRYRGHDRIIYWKEVVQ